MSEEPTKLHDYTPHFNGKVIEIRHMGYDFLDALLELTDNSAAKKCMSKNIYVVLHEGKNNDKGRLAGISVIDDGRGMDLNSLRDSFIFNLLKIREEGDIGKFHVGMKYAAIVIGSDITILSRQNGKTVGLWADIDTMISLDTFSPTELCDDVTTEWAHRHVDKDDYKRFMNSDTGTLISIKRLEIKCKGLISKVTTELQKTLPNSYMNLYNDCSLHLFNDIQSVLTITPNNLFYIGDEQKLDVDHKDYNKPLVYSTELAIYRDVEGSERVIETNSSSRTTYNKDFAKKFITNGNAKRPLYYEIKPKRGTNNRLSVDIVEIPFDSLPDKGTQVGVVKLRFIQVSDETYKSEKELFPEGSKLQGDRKGFFFNREIRIVGAAKQLGTKFGDRVTMAGERQRCMVEFTSDSDSLVGSKYNKQMSEHALPSKVLNDSLLYLWKQVTNNWTKLYPGKPKADISSDDEGSVEEISVLPPKKQDNNSIYDFLTDTSKKQKSSTSSVVTNEEKKDEKNEIVGDGEDSVVSLTISEAESGSQTESVVHSEEQDEITAMIENAEAIYTNEVAKTPVSKPDDYTIECDGTNISVNDNNRHYVIENLNNPKQLYDWVQSQKKNVGLYNVIVQTLLSGLYNYQEIQKHS